MYSVWSFFIQRKKFSAIVVFVLVAFGVMSIMEIPRESAPEVRVPVVVVSTVLPGANALDVETLLTDPVEDGLIGSIENVKKITSTSREGVSVVVVEFNADANIDTSLQKVKDEVDKVKPELPDEAIDPVVNDVNFADQPIMIVSLVGDIPPAEFVRIVKDVSNDIESIQGVSRVESAGLREREVQVIVDPEKLQTFQTSLISVSGALARNNSALPAGSIQQNGIEYNIRLEGDINDPSEVANLPVGVLGGEPFYVRDIAFVSDGVEPASSLSRVSIEGAPARQSVSLQVFKQSGGDITRIASNVRARLSELETTTLSGMDVLVSFDSGELVEDDLLSLVGTGAQTIVLVIFVLFIALGWRESLLAGLAIPLSFLVAFIGLSASGNTLNFVSLFALILSVGILVDSAIVITEGVHARLEQGKGKQEAALQTVKEFHIPLLSGTMTTIAVFAPLFLVSGVTGEFIASIPFTIIFVLLASLVVALAIVPLVASLFLRKDAGGKNDAIRERYTKKMRAWYENKLKGILSKKKTENRILVAVTILFFLSFVLPVTGIVKTVFFPQEDIDFIFIEVEKPAGTALGDTDLAIRGIEEMLYGDDRIESFITTVGAQSSFSESSVSGPRFANITINLKKDREQSSSVITQEIREKFQTITTFDVRVFEPNSGPPTGAPISVKVFGEDLDDIKKTSGMVLRELENIPGTAEVQASALEENLEFAFSINRAEATRAGIDSITIAQTLRTALFGTTATTIRSQGEDIDVVVKLALNPDYSDSAETSYVSLDALRYIPINTPNGDFFLGAFVEEDVVSGTSVVEHEDSKRFASVSSQISQGANAVEVTDTLKDRLSELDIPEGVSVNIGGENEDVDQSFRDLFLALFLGVALVASILVLQFNSFRNAFFVVIIIPLSLIGIFVGLALTGKSLSFPSIMGFIALSGIVVNNSIILIDTFQHLRRQHRERGLVEIVQEGAGSRLRPILLTTITTVIGIFPLTYAAEIWSPLAYAIIFGLTFSLLVTLVVIPILYCRWARKEIDIEE